MTLLIAFIDQAATATGLVKGTNLFATRLPELPDAAVCVYEYDGKEAQYVMGAGDVLDRPRFQVLARGTRNGYAAARVIIGQIHAALDVTEQDWDGWRVHRSMPLYTPASLGNDEADRPMIGCRFELTVTRA